MNRKPVLNRKVAALYGCLLLTLIGMVVVGPAAGAAFTASDSTPYINAWANAANQVKYASYVDTNTRSLDAVIDGWGTVLFDAVFTGDTFRITNAVVTCTSTGDDCGPITLAAEFWSFSYIPLNELAVDGTSTQEFTGSFSAQNSVQPIVSSTIGPGNFNVTPCTSCVFAASVPYVSAEGVVAIRMTIDGLKSGSIVNLPSSLVLQNTVGSTVPEPGSALMLVGGLAGLAFLRKRMYR
ncbi:PEP-CTERM sorting domain-containing protein [Paludibaculum fermentans]|uniref:PEP-CTERM sorting domain-containing protein n=1 Tax=Paludibaculum fermentans TaxID=1473598 RepID=UPI003EB83371